MSKKESRLKKIFSQAKPAKKDCCSVTIEEVKEDNCCDNSKEKYADSKKG